MPNLNILDGTGAGRSSNVNASHTINLYPEIGTDPAGKAQITLVSTPGCNLWVLIGTGPIRGQRPFAGLLFVVSGGFLYSVTSTGIVTQLGALTTSTGRVSMIDNGVQSAGIGGNQIMVVDGVQGYVYNIVTGAFTVVTSPGFPATPRHLAYQDGYGILTDGDMVVRASDQYDLTSWQAVAQTPVQFLPDTVQSVVGMPQGLVLVKQSNTEFYYDAGTPTSIGFPFTRLQGAVIPYGTMSPWSLILTGGTAAWLAWQQTDSGPVFIGPVLLNGYSIQPIAPQAIVYQMSLWTDVANVFGWSYAEGGHIFAAWTSPGDNQTLVFDLTTNKWHDRSTSTDGQYVIGRHVCNAYARFNNRHLVGDYLSGNIYQMADCFNTDFGLPIPRVRIAGNIFDRQSLSRLFISQFQIDLETGVRNPGPTVPAAATAALSGDGVGSVTVTSPGYDFVTAPQIVFVPVDGNGGGAAGTATIANGQIVGITVTTTGAGYTAPPQVIIVDPGLSDNPIISIAWSKDGGHTFGNERVKPLGTVGQYKTRVLWQKQGAARDRVLQVRCVSNSTRIVLIGGYAEVEE